MAAPDDVGYAQSGARRRSAVELRERGARLASALAARGIGRDASVALLLRNDLAVLETLIATGLLGAYAVPLNWHLKADEVRYIVEDSGARVLVAHADLLRALPPGTVPPGCRVLVVETPPELQGAFGIEPAAARFDASAAADRGDAAAVGRADTAESFDAAIATAEPWADTALVGSRGSIVYTSGTTGRPKGVRRLPLDAEAARRFAQLGRDWFGLRPGLRTVMTSPLYHSVAGTYAKAALSDPRGRLVLMPRFEPEPLLAAIEAHRITHLHLVPTMFIRLLRLPDAVRARYDLSSLEFVIHGAAPCPPEVKRAMIDWWGPLIHEYYGATETGMVSRSSAAEWLARPGTVGRPWPGRSVRIVGEDGRACAPGEAGEVFCSLDGVPQFEYVNGESLRRAVDRDGLVTCGDIGYVDDDGYLFLVDRKKDMVISGGVNIYPAEIESALALHPGVADAAVVGGPDPEFGERVVAYVVPVADSGLDAESVVAWLRERIAHYKVPKVVELVAALPRDANGKLQKRALREPLWADRAVRI